VGAKGGLVVVVVMFAFTLGGTGGSLAAGAKPTRAVAMCGRTSQQFAGAQGSTRAMPCRCQPSAGSPVWAWRQVRVR
jgi:hypothetical protein